MTSKFFIRRDFADIEPFLDAVRAQADSEREALGFLPEPAYAEHARQRKLILLLTKVGKVTSYTGHLLFGGIFPHLRVRQICIAPKYRRQGHATTLLRALISQGEKEGYLSITANVAADLTAANSFYETNGFLSLRLKSGGLTRNRKINVRVLELETPSLIPLMTARQQPSSIQVLLPAKPSHGVPLYAIDLNVFFDLIRTRARTEKAGAIFEAAMRHQIRLATSQEFVRELQRTSNYKNIDDPVLSLAKRIPSLPKQDEGTIEKLLPVIAKTVFPERFANKRLKTTDNSDVAHLVHAIAAGASGYITSDAKVLSARDALMAEYGLDIIGLSEFADLIDLPADDFVEPEKHAKHFRISQPAIDETRSFFNEESASIDGFMGEANLHDYQRLSVSDDDGIIGISLLKPARALDAPSQSIVSVRQEHPFASTVADFLISEQIRSCSRKRACRISMLDFPSQPITRRIALSQGYQIASGAGALAKIALGYPVTDKNWPRSRLLAERLAGLKLPKTCPSYDKTEIKIATSNLKSFQINLFDLETILSPTLFAFSKRGGVIVPIARTFAADLLGTDDQFSFLDLPEAQFLSRRTYFNTIRASRAMIRGSAIAFYESSKGGGRGAIVAIARILDVTSTPVDCVPEALQRGAVVETPGTLTKSERVLATTFDNLLVLRNPVHLKTLRKIGCATGANFVSATRISPSHLKAIVAAGWSNE